MADISRTVAIIFEGENRVTVATDGIVRSFDAVGTTAGDAASKVGQVGDEAEKLGSKSQNVGVLTDAIKALAASLIVKDFIDANLAAEQFNRTMTLVTGSTEAARAEFEYIRETSNRLGIDTRDAADAYAKFSSAVAGTALEGDGARVIFEGFAGTMAQLGASSADISGAFVQLAQGISKGKFELEDLKSIAERVPGFFNKMAESLGVTNAELFDMISNGQVTGESILALANAFNESLADGSFDGFNNELARLKNAITDAFLTLGDAGAWEIVKTGLQLGTAAIVGAIAVTRLLGETAGNLAYTLSSGDWSGFGERFDESMARASASVEGARNALLGANDAVAQVGFNAVDAGTKLQQNLQDAATKAQDLGGRSEEASAILKDMGISKAKLNDPLKDFILLFEQLLGTPNIDGATILQGFEATLKKIKEFDSATVSRLGADLATAFNAGLLSAEEYAKAASELSAKVGGYKDAATAAAEAQKKQTAEVDKAKQAAMDYALELQKIASDERIKLIEATVTLNVAQVEADAKRVQAAFESIGGTIDSTGDLLGDLFGLLVDFDNLNWTAIDLIQDQIELENQRRQQALDLQKRLIEAEIARIEAQTRAIDGGDALIKIDGAGLQPHLEAFMWEILKAIQTRVNQQGLAFLLGV